MNNLMIASKDIVSAEQGLIGKGDSITQEIQAIKITDEITQEAAIVLKQENQKFIVLVHEAFDELVSDAHQLHKKAVAKLKENLAPFENNKSIIQKKLTDYMLAEKRKKEEEERKRQAKLRKEEEERRAKEEAARLREAERLEKAGDIEGAEQSLNMAEEVRAQEIIIPERNIAKEMKKSGVQMRTTWKYRVINPLKVKREFLMLDVVINRTVTALKKDANEVVGGIEAYADTKAI